MAAQVGYVLAGRFRLDREISRGDLGVVFRATELETGRVVADKVMYPEDARHAARVQAEAAAVAGPDVVEVLAVESDEHGLVHVVMELLEGEPLDRHLSEMESFGDRARLGAALDLLSPVARALGAAHERGVVHGAIKPSNVFVVDEDAGGGVKLLDFGTPRRRSLEVTSDPRALAAAAYLAPEQWRGALADPRSDAYALAAVAFRILAGATPFAARSSTELFDRVARGPRPALTSVRRDVDPAVDAWIERALAIDPARRFPSVGGMWSELVAALLRSPSPSLAKYRAG